MQNAVCKCVLHLQYKHFNICIENCKKPTLYANQRNVSFVISYVILYEQG